jgi:hypothetical protein
MPGLLDKRAKCWKCGQSVIAVTRKWSTDNDRATVEFHHITDSLGRRWRPCVVRTTFDRSERAMKGLPRT